MPPEAEPVSPISCGLCRQRKCKCDRSLPFCSQCSANPSKCNYPESGKRGLPLGYINQLEMRLADTELALYEALATLRTMNGPSLVRASKKAQISPKQKAARMEEWTQFPLHEPSDLERWLEAKSDQFTIINNVREQRTMFSIEANNRDAGFRPREIIQSRGSTVQRQNARPSQMSRIFIGTDSPDGSRSSLQMSINQATSPSTPGGTSLSEPSGHGFSEQVQASFGEVMMSGEENQISKAVQLSKKHPAMYF